MSTPRRNITVNLEEPVSYRDHYAVVILRELNADPHAELLSSDLRAALVAEYGHAKKLHIDNAIKGLRNLGYAIDAVKRREYSHYRLATTPQRRHEYVSELLAGQYSHTVTTARFLAGAVVADPADPIVAAAHSQAVRHAIEIGAQLGFNPAEVVEECEILEEV